MWWTFRANGGVCWRVIWRFIHNWWVTLLRQTLTNKFHDLNKASVLHGNLLYWCSGFEVRKLCRTFQPCKLAPLIAAYSITTVYLFAGANKTGKSCAWYKTKDTLLLPLFLLLLAQNTRRPPTAAKSDTDQTDISPCRAVIRSQQPWKQMIGKSASAYKHVLFFWVKHVVFSRGWSASSRQPSERGGKKIRKQPTRGTIISRVALERWAKQGARALYEQQKHTRKIRDSKASAGL